MIEIVAADIGGTHARFALAEIADGRVLALGPTTTLRTADHASLERAWAAFGAAHGRRLPRDAGIAAAGPVSGGEPLEVTLTNNSWRIRPAALRERLGLARVILVNDFAAQAHAAAQLGPDWSRPLCGPERPRGQDATVTVVGPGTGLGVALLVVRGGRYEVVASEGGHVAFAPLDAFEDALVQALRQTHGRVSAERIVAGPGLSAIHAALAREAGRAEPPHDDAALWTLALAGTDPLADAALELFCRALGSVAGDLALAHGASEVVIAGGLGRRLAERLPRSGFAGRFVGKGRFEAMMRAMPVRLLVHEQPGLWGAAAAFARAHPG